MNNAAHKQVSITNELGEYIGEHSLREHKILTALRKETEQLSNATMLSDPNQIQFLTLLLRVANAKKGIEGK